MKKSISICLLSLIAFSPSLFALDANDCRTINQIIEHFTNAWNCHAGKGSADYYSQDGDFVNIFGMAFAGKQEIEDRHLDIHKSFLKGSLFEVVDIRLRESKAGLVIAHVYWKVSNIQKPGNDSASESMQGVFTHVFVRNQDGWEITASQNTCMPN